MGMTREEEIKARLTAAQCTSKGIKHIMDAKDILRENAEDDIHYLLARNEKLQRRVDRLEKVYERSRDLIYDGIYGGEYYDTLLDTVAIDRATGKNTRAVALFDALISIDAADAEEK